MTPEQVTAGAALLAAVTAFVVAIIALIGKNRTTTRQIDANDGLALRNLLSQERSEREHQMHELQTALYDCQQQHLRDEARSNLAAQDLSKANQRIEDQVRRIDELTTDLRNLRSNMRNWSGPEAGN